MSTKLLISTAVALSLAQVAPPPLAAQTADQMARPLPAPIPETRPETLPNRPNRPPGNNNNWNNNNSNNNWGGSGGSWNNNNNNWNGGNWSGQTIRCESRDGRRHNCRANTSGGVRLVRQLSNTPCQQGRTWGTSGNSIWVDNGCRGEFQLRYGSGTSGSSSSGPSAGAIIGGVAVAGGLIALLSQSGKSSNPPANNAGNVAGAPLPQQPADQPPALPAAPAGPARINAQMGGVTPDARPSLQTCLNEAARQVGATGGTEIRLDRLDDIQPGNGGFRFRFQLIAVYPDETRTIPTFCRATPTTLVELTFG